MVRKVAMVIMFGFLFFLTMMCGCVHLPHVDGLARALPDQQRATVKVQTLCIAGDPWTPESRFTIMAMSGSGVVIDDRHVLTAAHVVDCGGFDSSIYVTFSNGKRWRVENDRLDRGNDMARLEDPTAGNFNLGIAPPVLGTDPQFGDDMCSAFAVPKLGGSCGHLIAPDMPGRYTFDAPTHHGNSGGGVYSGGKLVGLVTNMNADSTHGAAAPIKNHLDWFAK